MNIALESLRPCLDGAVPAVVAAASPDGTPNVAYASQVHYVDPEHVALSFQFFSKTRENVLAHPYAQVQVIEPVSFRHFRLKVHYLRTETSGPLFEYMKAQLAGIAARTGMAKVFELRGADVYRVLDIENVNPRLLSAPAPPDALLKLRGTLDYLGACDDLAQLADRALAALARGFGIRHALLAMLDESGGALYMLASLGYPASDVGAEVALGEGLIGVAAREAIAVRINHHTGDYIYHAALQVADPASPRIPLPVLVNPHSQIAVPLMHGARLVGVLYAESEQNAFFSHADEVRWLSTAVTSVRWSSNSPHCPTTPSPRAPHPRPGPPVHRSRCATSPTTTACSSTTTTSSRVWRAASCGPCSTNTLRAAGATSAIANCGATRVCRCRISATTWRHGLSCCSVGSPNAVPRSRWQRPAAAGSGWNWSDHCFSTPSKPAASAASGCLRSPASARTPHPARARHVPRIRRSPHESGCRPSGR